MSTGQASSPGCLAEYEFNSDSFAVTPEMRSAFAIDGAFIVRHLLSAEEVQGIWTALLTDGSVLKHAFAVPDGEGHFSRMALWGHPGNDITGVMARSEKLAGTCEKLLGGEVYHYHTKIMMKEAKTGGKHLWHQDYGYWYKNGNLRPDMMTVFVALDPCTKVNGGLQMLKGTHRCGRIDHNLDPGQMAADLERVDQLSKHFEHVYAELQPGDALFFHCNVLHTSDKNDSDVRRWAFLVCYNRADNNPVYKHHHPNYTPLVKVPNSAILECTNYTDLSGKDFLDPNQDQTIRVELSQSRNH